MLGGGYTCHTESRNDGPNSVFQIRTFSPSQISRIGDENITNQTYFFPSSSHPPHILPYYSTKASIYLPLQSIVEDFLRPMANILEKKKSVSG